MIAVDTNVLVRLLVNDDAEQALKARKLFDAHADEDGSIWISDAVLVELVWTLARAYGRERSEIVVALRALRSSATVAFEASEPVDAAIALYEKGPADFADCLLAATAHVAGCAHVVTFDRKMQSLPGVRVL
jgi:predicted nucleic-acid-binding protein